MQEHTGTTAVEKPIKAEVKHPSDLLDKVDMEHAPDLSGYVRFETRPTADEILAVDGTDPLLVRWQYGLGRAAVFSSDAKSRWAASWLTWPGFDRLWTNIFRDLLPHGNESEAVARYDGANEELVVDYHLSGRAAEPATPPDLYVIGPGDFRKPLDLARVSPGTYRGRLRIGSLEGLFRVRPLNESRAFPEVGLVPAGIGAVGLRLERSAAEVDCAIDRRPVQSIREAAFRYRRQVHRFHDAALARLARDCAAAESDRTGDAQMAGHHREHSWRAFTRSADRGITVTSVPTMVP